MAISIGATLTNSGNKTSATSYSYNHTCDANTKCLVAVITGFDGTAADLAVTGVTYDTVAMTKADEFISSAGYGLVSVWYLPFTTTPSGAKALAVTHAGKCTDTQCEAVNLVSSTAVFITKDSSAKGTTNATTHPVSVNPARTNSIAVGGITDEEASIDNLGVSVGTQIGTEIDMGSQVSGTAWVASSGGTADITWTMAATKISHACVVTFYEQFSPSVALGTPEDDATITDTTPALTFTGTDTESNELEYEVQVNTSSFVSTPAIEDNFDDNIFDTTKWTRWNGTQEAEANNELEITTTTSAVYYGVNSVGRYDLTASSVFLQWVDEGNTAFSSYEAYPLQLLLDSSNKLQILNAGGTVYYKKVVATSSTTLATEAYSATNHAWLRIREASGTVYFDRSSDGISWTNVTSTTVASLFAVTSLYVEISAGCWAVEASTTTMKIDNFNLEPVVLDVLSSTDDDANWAGTGAPNPFPSGNEITYTIPAGSALTPSASPGTTYYWRVRAIDPLGSNTWGAWSPGDSTLGYDHFHLEEVSANKSVNVYDSANVSEDVTVLRTSHNVSVFDSVNVSEGITSQANPQTASVFDTVNVSEDITAKVPLVFVDVFDSITVAEDTQGTLPLAQASVFDTINVSEIITTQPYNLVPNVYDQATVSEDITAQANPQSLSVADDIQVAENITAEASAPIVNDLSVSVYDSVTVAEDTTVLEGNLVASIYDSVTVAETVTALEANLVASVVDNIAVSESTTVLEKNLVLSVADSITVAEDITSRVPQVFVNVFDSVTTAEDITGQVPYAQASVVDNVSVSENVSGIVPAGQVSVFDSIAVSENIVSKLPIGQATVVDNNTVSEYVNLQQVTPDATIDVSDPVFVSELVTVWKSTQTISVSDDLTVSENITIYQTLLNVNVFDSIVVSEGTTAMEANLVLSVIDSVAASENLTISPSTLFVSVVDNIAVSEAVALTITLPKTIDTADNVAVSENIQVKLDHYEVSVSDTITVADNLASRLANLVLSVYDFIQVSDIPTAGTSTLNLSVFDNLTASDGGISFTFFDTAWHDVGGKPTTYAQTTNPSSTWTPTSSPSTVYTASTSPTTGWTDINDPTTSWTPS
jgi:hypothetical protein